VEGGEDFLFPVGGCGIPVLARLAAGKGLRGG
jgi:hypothetical protein